MTTVKFDRAVKYMGIRYGAHEAFKVADNEVEELMKAGAIVLSSEADAPASPEPNGKGEEESAGISEGQNEEDVSKLKEELLTYTVSQLTEFAQERGIDLQGKTRKADIYNFIVASFN